MAWNLQTFRIIHDFAQGARIDQLDLSDTGFISKIPTPLYEGDSFELQIRCYEHYSAGVKTDFGVSATAKLYIKYYEVSDVPTELATGVISESVVAGGYDTLTFAVDADLTDGYGGSNCLIYAVISDTDRQRTVVQQITLSKLDGDANNPTASGMSYTPADETDWTTAPDDVAEALDTLADDFTNHDHDSDYSAIGHDHDSEYSAIDHDHDSEYADISHTHTNITDQITSIAGTVNQYEVYYLSGTTWTQTDATDNTGGCDKLLAIAGADVSDNDATDGMVLSGFVTNDSWSWTGGEILYMSTTVGAITATAPSGSGQIIRPIGYAVNATQIYFDPDKHWIEIE